MCVFKVFLAIFPRPAVRGILNTGDRVQKVNLLLTNGTSYNVIQHSVNVLKRVWSLYNSVDDPTVEPTPSEKHCKREVLDIIGIQVISRDTPFLRWQADQ